MSMSWWTTSALVMTHLHRRRVATARDPWTPRIAASYAPFGDRASPRREARRPSGRADPRDEPLDPHQRLLDLLVSGGVAHPHVALAGRPERVPGHHGHLLLAQQPLRELVRGEPCRGDLREGVEGTAGLESRQADAVE